MTNFTGTVPDFTADEELTSTDMQTISDLLTALTDAWTSYTPTWSTTGTAPALGNGTLVGKYKQIGKTVKVYIALTAGSSTTFGSNTFTFALPVAAANTRLTGVAQCFDSSAAGNRCAGALDLVTSTTVDIYAYGNNSPGSPVGGNVASGVPFTWASGDRLVIELEYEAA
jgi:hypothetical protein